jgi:hypothetical protein
MKTFPPPPRLPTIPGPPRMPSMVPSLIPPPPPVMTEMAGPHGDTERSPAPSRFPSAYPRYPSAPPPLGRPSSRPSSPPSSRQSSPPRRSVPPAFFGVVAAAMMPACSVATRSEPPPAVQDAPLTLAQLEVTEGSLQQGAHGELHVGAPKVRAVAAVDAGDAAELRFVYRGPSAVQVPLDNGEDRHQVGLKLRAEDGCNVVYVMWQIKPVAKLTVSLKSNPGAHTYEQCGANGYKSIAPQWSAEAPVLRPGEAHALAASIEDGTLYVRIDGKVVWQGEAGPQALALHGPLGMRTDNVELDSVSLVPIGRLAASAPVLEAPPTSPTKPK